MADANIGKPLSGALATGMYSIMFHQYLLKKIKLDDLLRLAVAFYGQLLPIASLMFM